ncbi:O-methyltransferase [Nocardiopsis coralliicola]
MAGGLRFSPGPARRGRQHSPAGSARSDPIHGWEAAIAANYETLAHSERSAGEDAAGTADAALAAVRAAAGERRGVRPVSEACGAALRFLAAAIGARSVVEIGTGYGGSGIWLLRGMRPDAILTTVDVDPVGQESARSAFRAAGFSTNRTRLIRGRALEVLPRLTDGAYDLVFADAVRSEYPDYLGEALRLLRPGGVAVFHDALAASPLGDGPLSASDSGTAAIRDLGRAIREDEGLVPLLLPVGDGLLAAIRSERQGP